MSNVVLKGEFHSSQADHLEELDLMQEGIDALVLEGNEGDAEYRATEGWFQQAVAGMFYVLSPLYISKEILVRFAEYQNATVYFTRESDAEVLRNAPRLVRLFSAVLYFLLLPGSIIAGLLLGYLLGAGILFFSFALPVLFIRIYNSRFNITDRNRDRIMAQKIEEATDAHDTVLAVVGGAHADGVLDALPDNLDIEYHPPKKDGITTEGIWRNVRNGFQVFSLLLTLYLAILWSVLNLVLPVIQ
ncbi:hypothetical protein [Haloarchaeobius litoreus]|uniref:Uncharacterized protein n=1 Tax=Haloarchaeobius litoreus TaxID=755306 RepID=A0ABD6DI68_9EURY|nr:hypothetical protein [Haloarchaeobius litoreus]